MKNVCLWIAGCLVAAGCSVGEKGPLTIAARGKPSDYAVVVGEKPSECLRHAAEEFTNYVAKLTGVALPLVEGVAPAKGHSVFVRSKGLKDVDAFRFRTEGRDFVIEGYSLGLSAPVSDGDAAWFGHGGAFGTNCMVNWHRKELKLWVVQTYGGPFPWEKARAEAAKRFFSRPVDAAGVDAYTGRMK